MISRRKKISILLNILFFTAMTIPGVCHGKNVTGRQVAEWVYNREDGKDSTFTVKMDLVDRRGKERERDLVIQSMDFGSLVNTFIEFTSPADIAGTKLLTLEEKNNDNIQYLYLPALGRSRRVVGGQKKQSFMNTDYTYEDMERQHPDENTHKLLREEKFSEWDCYVVESIPVEDSDSQYSRMVVWVEKQSHVIVKTDYYDKKKRFIKRFTVTSLEKKDGIWTQINTVMEDLQRETKTVMSVKDAKYNQGLDKQLFTIRHLEQR